MITGGSCSFGSAVLNRFLTTVETIAMHYGVQDVQKYANISL